MISYFRRFEKNRSFFLINSILLFLLTNYVLSDWNCRKDLSRFNRFNLTESTERVLKNLPEKLFIDAFYSSDVPGEYKPRLDLAKEMVKEIAGVNRSKVELRFFDPDSGEADRKKANEFGIEPQTLQKVERGAAEVKQAYFGISLTLGDKSEVIPVTFFAEQVEYQILSTLKKMLRKNTSSGVGILKAPGANLAPQPGPGSGKDTFGVFINQAFSIENGPVSEITINEESVPEEITTLIWAGSPSLTEAGRYNVDQFLLKGGNLVIFAKTMDFSLEQRNRMGGMMGMGGEGMARASAEAAKTKEFTTHYGFEVKTDMILEPDSSMPIGPLVQVEPGVIGRYHYPLWIIASKKQDGISNKSIFTKNTEALLLPWTSAIEFNPEKQKDAIYSPIVESSPNASRKSDFLMIGETQIANSQMTPEGKKIPLAIHIEGTLTSFFKKENLPGKVKKETHLEKTAEGKKSQVIVFGSPYIVSDILATREFRETFQETNIPFVMNLLDALSGDTDLLAARGKKAG
ncbi:MAG: GldG family protein, partial [Leptospira sp.]|nr:GldG family protein [Leptospira sp.]